MSEEKNKKVDEQHTEELPTVENVVWHHEEEIDTLDQPVEQEVRMTPIEADEPEEKEDTQLHIGMQKKSNEADLQPLLEKKKSKKWMILTGITAVVVLLVCGGVFWYQNYQKKQEEKKKAYDKMYQQLKVTFVEKTKDEDGNVVDPTIIEYGSKEMDPLTLVETHYGDISCSPEVIETTKVGTQKIVYTVSMKDSYKEEVKREFSLSITVHDMQSPQIGLAESKLTITEGDSFDPKSNVTSVKDPVDGDLEFAEEEPEKVNDSAPYYENGWYTIDDEVDTETPGTYSVRIKACDKNGNATDVSYSVTVKQKDPTSFMTVGTNTYTKVMDKLTDTGDTQAGETGDWKDVDMYLGNVLYRSEQFTSLDEMMKQGKSYMTDHFDKLTENKEKKSIPIVGSISVDAQEATLYYMEALNEDGEIMYYFFAIV